MGERCRKAPIGEARFARLAAFPRKRGKGSIRLDLNLLNEQEPGVRRHRGATRQWRLARRRRLPVAFEGCLLRSNVAFFTAMAPTARGQVGPAIARPSSGVLRGDTKHTKIAKDAKASGLSQTWRAWRHSCALC